MCRDMGGHTVALAYRRRVVPDVPAFTSCAFMPLAASTGRADRHGRRSRTPLNSCIHCKGTHMGRMAAIQEEHIS